MPDLVRFRCNNCGERFEAEALNEAERSEARRDAIQLSSIHCPRCRRIDVRRGWE